MSRLDMFMRDMARGRMGMGRRDGRNPYGSRGGYITSRDPRRRDREGREYREDEHEYLGPEYPNREKMRDGHYMYPFELSGRFGYEQEFDPYCEEMMYDYSRGRGRDYNYGYDYRGGDMLSNRELMDWSQKLMQEIDEKDKGFFKYDNIEKKAKEMGVQFDKFSFDEFYTAVLMIFTDYCKTLGTANLDIYLRLAKDWLCDDDVAMKYGEKLASYYDYVVEGM